MNNRFFPSHQGGIGIIGKYSFSLISSLLLSLCCSGLQAEAAITDNTIAKSHAIAMHGSPKYPADFQGFDYTSSKAQKGGSLRLYGRGTFDSLNGYIAKGNAEENLGLIYDSLTTPAMDEPFTQYGLIAHTIEYPADRTWVVFHMRPEARFHDGHPVTAEDVVFTFNLLMEKGNPAWQFFYRDVEKVDAIDTHKVKFSFANAGNRELALSVGNLPVLPRHFWETREFAKSSLEIPLGSGPYQIASVDPGRGIVYSRVGDYWGTGLAVNRGLYNFDTINVDYYRDSNISIEALKADDFDFRRENVSKFWATAYDVPSVNNGQLIMKKIPHQANCGLQAFIFNLRKSIFQDIELRRAIGYAFDFEWSNQTLFYGSYKRSYSYFSNSELAATGLPGPEELRLLEPWRGQLPDSVFTKVWQPPTSDGSGWNRGNLRKAKKILDKAGYRVVDNQLYNRNNEAIRFEILIYSPTFERIINPFIKNLARLGIVANIRLVDTSQFINRRREFDYDMITHLYSQSESPGNEQRGYWGSEAADTPGSANYIGIKNPAIDGLIAHVVNAVTREELVTASRALDRALLHNYYVVPQWYKASTSIVYWNKFGMPDTAPIYDKYYSLGIHSWWYDENRADALTLPTNTASQ